LPQLVQEVEAAVDVADGVDAMAVGHAGGAAVAAHDEEV
jgi:hypothetical protein